MGESLMPPRKTPWGEWVECREVVPGVYRLKIPSGFVYWIGSASRVRVRSDLVAEYFGDKDRQYAAAGWYPATLPAAVAVASLAAGGDEPAFDTLESRAWAVGILKALSPEAAFRCKIAG